MTYFSFGVSHQTASVEERERLALNVKERTACLDRMQMLLPGAEVVVLSTCNRVEFHVAAATELHPLRNALRTILSELGKPGDVWGRHEVVFEGSEAVRHVFSVASGLQSMVVGETEILGQIKDAYEEARLHGATGRYLNRLFQTAFAAAKDARTHTSISRGSVSVGSVAVELAERIFGQLEETRVMILGAGDTSERVLRTLAAKKVKSVMVSNRSFNRAVALAESVGGEAHHWESWNALLPEMDIIISSTAAPHHVLKREDLESCMESRGWAPLFLIDLAVPRDIDPGAALIESVYLYDIDDLQSIAQANLKEREVEVSRCRQLLRKHEMALDAWMLKDMDRVRNAKEEGASAGEARGPVPKESTGSGL